MPEVLIDDQRVAYREYGAGAPALMLHCALAHSGAWSGLAARLGDRLAMRAPDLPGHGGTGRDPRLGNQDQAVANGLVLLADRGPAHVVGHSYGATVAMRLALEAPGRVASLTLIEPVLFALLAETDPAAFAREMAEAAPASRLMAAERWTEAATAFLRRWGGPGVAAGLAEAAAPLMPLVAESEREIGDPATATLARADLARIAAPTLVIVGTASPASVGSIAEGIAATVRGSRRVTVAGAGHMIPVTHAEATSAAIRDFLSLDEP